MTVQEISPRQIVEALDKYIIGQTDAKRAVAVALRNRWRRSRLPAEIRDEISPHNILMVGPTGVGKTEIARRLAKLVNAPFIKVEATKFTEVGYVGRDVDSIVRDLIEVAIRLVRTRMREGVNVEAARAARARVLDILVRDSKHRQPNALEQLLGVAPKQPEMSDEEKQRYTFRRTELEEQLASGELDQRVIEIEVEESAPSQQLPGTDVSIQDMLGPLMPKKKKTRKVTVAEACRLLETEECEKLIDNEAATTEAIELAEQSGIVFIDEIDKITAKGQGSGPDVSREGVQRDILPIVEGATVMTKYGPVKTDHMLFIAAGAFHIAQVSDLIPELQGRFPVRVNLLPLTAADFKAILSQTECAITRQSQALLAVDGVALEFTDDALEEIAAIAYSVNETLENIGARRLHALMETLLEDVSFNACGDPADVKLVIDAAYVKIRLAGKVKEKDYRRQII